MARNAGKIFEDDWKNSYKGTGYYYHRLIDSNKFNFGEGTRFTPPNPFDCIHYSMPFLYLLELKSTKGASISFDREKGDKKMIKIHQIKSLIEANKNNGLLCGFIFNFRERHLKTKSEPNRVFFVHIEDFVDFVNKTDKGSINAEDCERIGVEIEGNKKITRYTYNIEKFVNDSVVHYLKNGTLDIEVLKEINEWIDMIVKIVEVDVDEEI